MKKLLAAVAISALALTSAAPMVQAAERTTGLTKVENQSIHQVATQKKSTKKSTKKVTKTSGKKKTSKPASTPGKA